MLLAGNVKVGSSVLSVICNYGYRLKTLAMSIITTPMFDVWVEQLLVNLPYLRQLHIRHTCHFSEELLALCATHPKLREVRGSRQCGKGEREHETDSGVVILQRGKLKAYIHSDNL